jgi:hypothetical protein
MSRSLLPALILSVPSRSKKLDDMPRAAWKRGSFDKHERPSGDGLKRKGDLKMTTPNPAQPVSHVEIAALVTRLALKRLEADANAADLTWIKLVLDGLIERSLQE